MAPDSIPQCEFDTSKLLVRLNVVFAADVKAVSDVSEGVVRIMNAMGCACGKEYEVEMALRESLANAVVHGAKGDPSKMVQCCVACDETRGMLIIVRDPGSGFDPESLPSPLIGEHLYSEHGRGIYLINQLMDDVQFKRGGTEIHMRKLSQPEKVPPNCGL